MSDLDILRELAEDSRAWVSSRASMAVAVAEQYEGGGLDDTEFMDIMNNILDDDLDQQADDLDTKAVLVTAVLGTANII